MAEYINAVNRLPSITWRWVKVNELYLDNLIIPEIKEYEYPYLKSTSHGNIEIKTEIKNMESFCPLKDEGKDYGVSEDLVNFAKKHYNSSLLIHAPKGEVLKDPIKIYHMMDNKNPNLIDNNIIIGEEDSEITVIMEYNTEKNVRAFHNGITRIYAKDGAKINIIKVQNMNEESNHFDSNMSIIGYNGEVNYISVEIGGKASITNYVNNLNGTESKSQIKSIYLGRGDEIKDINYLMNQRGRRSRSNIETRGVLKDRAKKTFKATIDFKKGASKSKGAEEEYAILLDPTVKADAAPLLLCQEDDVDGAHAASAGRIDENKLFYIMSRGFNEKDARKLIIEASFRPIIDEIVEDDLREKILDEIQRRLTNE